MKKLLRIFSTILFAGVITATCQERSIAISDAYSCALSNDVYQTRVKTGRGITETVIYWDGKILKTPPTLKKQCEDVSKKLQIFREQTRLKFLKAGKYKNGNPAICAIKNRESCGDNNLLLELPMGVDAATVLKNLIIRKNGEPLHLSNEIAFFENGEFYIDFDKLINYLDNPYTAIVKISEVLPGNSANLRQQVPDGIAQLAKSITVRIEGPDPQNHGSGIIIKSTGSEYTVLTSFHFMDGSGLYTVYPPNTSSFIRIDSAKIQQIRGYDAVVFKFFSHESYQVAKKCLSNPTPNSLIFSAGWANPDGIFQNKHFVVSPANLYDNKTPTSEGADFVYLPQYIFSGMSGGPVISSEGCVFAYTHSIKQSPLTGRTDLVEAISLKILEPPKPFDRRNINIAPGVEPGMPIPQPPEISTLEVPPHVLVGSVPPDLKKIIFSLEADIAKISSLNQALSTTLRQNSISLGRWDNRKSISDLRQYYDQISQLNRNSVLMIEQIKSASFDSVIYWNDESKFEKYLSFHNVTIEDREKIRNLIVEFKKAIQDLGDKEISLSSQRGFSKIIMEILERQIER
jgi:hypothetical protein